MEASDSGFVIQPHATGRSLMKMRARARARAACRVRRKLSSLQFVSRKCAPASLSFVFDNLTPTAAEAAEAAHRRRRQVAHRAQQHYNYHEQNGWARECVKSATEHKTQFRTFVRYQSAIVFCISTHTECQIETGLIKL